MPDWDWQQIFIFTVPPFLVALVTVGGPIVSAKLKARQSAAVSDVEMGFRLRDELRAELDRLKHEIAELRALEEACQAERDELRREVDTLRSDVTRLQDQVRRGVNGAEGRRGA